APADAQPRPAGDLHAPYADASPVLHRDGDALRRPARLARDLLPALRAGDLHPDVDARRPGARLAAVAERRLAGDDDDHQHVPDLRVHALLLPRRGEPLRALVPAGQHPAAPPYRPSR